MRVPVQYDELLLARDINTVAQISLAQLRHLAVTLQSHRCENKSYPHPL